jgi:sporulation protein YlmC with PRC-barrel domain
MHGDPPANAASATMNSGESNAEAARSVIAASALEGERVVNHLGDTIGEIEEIMLDVATGHIAYAVLAAGGFLGMGEKYFAVPWRALSLDTGRQCFVLGIDRDTLADAPAFDRDHWPSMTDDAWAAALHAFYRVEPYWK